MYYYKNLVEKNLEFKTVKLNRLSEQSFKAMFQICKMTRMNLKVKGSNFFTKTNIVFNFDNKNITYILVMD